MSQAKSKRHNPEGLSHRIGLLLYSIGFQTEYTCLCLVRGVRKALSGLWIILVWIISGIIRSTKPFLMAMGQDLLGPWESLRQGLRNLRVFVSGELDKGPREAFRAGWGYFVRGVRTYRSALRRGLNYLLPLGALVLFVFTVQSVLSTNFALRVEYNGQMLGFIANESVFEEAQKYVKARIRNAESNEWSMHPVFQVVSVNSAALMNREDLANRMIEATGSDIADGVGVLVDDVLIGATADTNTLYQALEQIRNSYLNPDNPNVRAEFVRNVQLVYGLYLQDSLLSTNDIMDRLTGNVAYMTAEGAEYQDNLLRVKQVERITYQQEVPYQTVQIDDTSLSWGAQVIQQPGSNGLLEVTQDVSYIDGVETTRDTLQTVTLLETQDEIVRYGVLSEYGVVGEVGTGNLIWPVPEYTGVSRGISSYHRGLDITARRGVPIYACDNAVVEFAGRDSSGYNWTYGNYVALDHGNGMTTLYAHMVAVRADLRTGDYVEKGELIGYIGSTGNSSGNHLHLEVAVNGILTNPYNYITRP